MLYFHTKNFFLVFLAVCVYNKHMDTTKGTQMVKTLIQFVRGAQVASVVRVLDSKPAAVWAVQDVETGKVFKVMANQLR